MLELRLSVPPFSSYFNSKFQAGSRAHCSQPQESTCWHCYTEHNQLAELYKTLASTSSCHVKPEMGHREYLAYIRWQRFFAGWFSGEVPDITETVLRRCKVKERKEHQKLYSAWPVLLLQGLRGRCENQQNCFCTYGCFFGRRVIKTLCRYYL